MATRCRSCGSEQVIPNAELQLNASGRSVAFEVFTGAQGAPGSWWDKEAVRAKSSRCDICCGCGRIELLIDEPAQLWAAYVAASDAAKAR